MEGLTKKKKKKGLLNKINQTRAGLAALRADKNMAKAASNHLKSKQAFENSESYWNSANNNRGLSNYERNVYKGYAIRASKKGAEKQIKANKQINRANRQYARANRLMGY